MSKSSLRVFMHSHKGKRGSYLSTTFRFAFSDTGQAVIKIEYDSVYGDRWRVRWDEYVPRTL